MKLKFSEDDGLILVSAEGRITEGPHEMTSDPLMSGMGPTVYSRKLLLDLSQVDYISSSGLGWLITCHKKTREAGGAFIIHSVVPLVWQMIAIMKLDRLLSTAPDLDAAKSLVEATA